MQRLIRPSMDDPHFTAAASVNQLSRPRVERLSREIVEWRGDNRHPVTMGSQVTRKLVVAGAPGFIKRRKDLVDKQDVHA